MRHYSFADLFYFQLLSLYDPASLPMSHPLHIIPPYSRSADFYDELMADIDYKGWAEYLLDLSAELNIQTDAIIDFSCGTGTLLHHLSAGARRIRGLDISKSMIRQAKEKYPENEWFVGNMMTTFMPDNFTLGLNLHDSLNYIKDTDVLKHYIHRMQKSCKPGQSLFFDFALPALIKRYFINQDEIKKWGTVTLSTDTMTIWNQKIFALHIWKSRTWADRLLKSINSGSGHFMN